MADTGAPHFIPFADPTDLVRDWPALSEDVADAVAAGLTAAGNAGIGSNVVSTTKTDVFTTASTSFTALTGLSATITPTSATSKILVTATVMVGANSNNIGYLQLLRGASDLIVADSPGSRTASWTGFMANFASAGFVVAPQTVTFLDSPSTTAATTYSVNIRVNGGTWYVNRSEQDENNADNVRGVSTITAIEVAA